MNCQCHYIPIVFIATMSNLWDSFIYKLECLREAAKKVFFSGQSTQRGWGVRGCPLMKTFFFSVSVLFFSKPRLGFRSGLPPLC